MERPLPLVHPLLLEIGVVHGFGVCGALGPADLHRPRQVHGCAVAEVDSSGCVVPEDADAIIGSGPDVAVGIVTADCVPILIAAEDGGLVAAVHAGWRGLARGVISAALTRLVQLGARRDALRAVVGPHIGACCYEVDAPVIDAMRSAFGPFVELALAPSGPEHWQLALGKLARQALLGAGVGVGRVGALGNACTACDTQRFFSYRRQGAQAGRLVHFIRSVAS